MVVEDVVTSVLVLMSIAGPMLLLLSRRVGRRPDDDPLAVPPRHGALYFGGCFLTLFGWPLLALWAWMSSWHFGMM